MYHTKLEQLLTLTNRLSALGRTLGPEFYSADILEPTPTIGESEYNSNAQRDVTPERFSKLEKELVRGKAEVVRLPVMAGVYIKPTFIVDKTASTTICYSGAN